jgi:hypothetical protein
MSSISDKTLIATQDSGSPALRASIELLARKEGETFAPHAADNVSFVDRTPWLVEMRQIAYLLWAS